MVPEPVEGLRNHLSKGSMTVSFITYLARNSSFLKIKHKIDFTKKLFNYENTGRKKEAGKNMRKSETIVSLPTCACSDAS